MAAYSYSIVRRFVGRFFMRETEAPAPETEAEPFCISVIGDEGAGKSNLINRLLEEDVATVQHSAQRFLALKVACYSGRIHGVPVNMYEFSALSSSSHLKQELQLRNVHAFVCCIRVSETRMRGSVIAALEGYHSAGVDWSKTTMVLTFADRILVPKELKHEPTAIGEHFEQTVTQWQSGLRKVLVKKIGVKVDVVEKMPIYPATGDADKLLPNEKQWLIPLQFAIITLLPPEAMKMYQDSLLGCGKALKQRYNSTSEETCEELATTSRHADLYSSLTSQSVSSCEETHSLVVHSLKGLSGTHEENGTSAACLATSMSAELEIKAKLTAPSVEQTQFWQSVRDMLLQLRMECPIFGILVIGETGSGKSTLINNLLGRAVAPVGHTMNPGTINVTPHELSVEGVPVVVYDTPGLDDLSGMEHDKENLKMMKSLLARTKIHLVIYCWKMTENRMRRGLIRTFKEYCKIGVPWQQTVVALTFADMVTEVFDNRLPEMYDRLTAMLVEEAGLTESVAKTVKVCPTTAHYEEVLPNGRPWYVPFWLNVQKILIPAAMARFLDMHKDNISDDRVLADCKPNQTQINLTGPDKLDLAKSFAATLPISKTDQDKIIDAILDTGPDAIRQILSEGNRNEDLKNNTHVA